MKTEFEYPKNGYVDLATNVGHKVVGITILFGKEYAWLKDQAGTHYLARTDI